MTIDELREFFKADLFAMEQGITIDRVSENEAECSMKLKPVHRNAAGGIQGGVLFTLADFTFAVLANSKGINTVSLGNTIQYLSTPKGDSIRAVAETVKDGRAIISCEVRVYDKDVVIAEMICQGFHKR